MSGATPVELASRDWRDWRAGVTLTPMANGWPSHQESSTLSPPQKYFSTYTPQLKFFCRDREVVFDGLMAGPAIRPAVKVVFSPPPQNVPYKLKTNETPSIPHPPDFQRVRRICHL